MRSIFSITAILLLVGLSVSVCYPDPVRETEILKLMTTVPENLTCATGNPWYSFAYQQHDDLTTEVLLNLYRTASDEKVRRLALGSLRHQKKAELVLFWQGILQKRDKVDDQSVANAIYGLGTINSQQSNRILLSLLSEKDPSPETLVRICYVFRGNGVPKEGVEQIVALTSHVSEKVRRAAFDATSFRIEALRDKLLGQALADTSPAIIRWGLYWLPQSENISPQLFPIVFDYLAHSDPYVRVAADEALSYLLGGNAPHRDEKFEMLQTAFEEKRWSYETAPLLALRYARILEEGIGELAEAEKAYQTAQQAYALSDAYNASNHEPGATMLYRLIQVKQKRGDIEGAIAVLNRLVKEYPARTRIYAHDFPVPGYNMDKTVQGLETRLRARLNDSPIRISILPLNETYPAGQKLKFKVSIQNITNDSLILHCTHRNGWDVLVPCRPVIVVDARHWIDFEETVFLVDAFLKVTISPNESFSFIGTLGSLQIGNHVIDFRFKPVCEFENGALWSEMMLANSATIEIK